MKFIVGVKGPGKDKGYRQMNGKIKVFRLHKIEMLVIYEFLERRYSVLLSPFQS